MTPDVRDVRQRVTTELHPPGTTAAEISMLARQTDPAWRHDNPAENRAAAAAGGVRWVNALDVLQNQGARLSGLHADGQENLVRHLRGGMAQLAHRRGAARQAGTLPPVTWFGQTPAVAALARAVNR